jgi:hypothetical protein
MLRTQLLKYGRYSLLQGVFLGLFGVSAIAQSLAPSQSTRLIAGQNIDVGSVTCGYVPDSLTNGRCNVVMERGWCVDRVHLYVGAQEPQSLAPGQFPYQSQPQNCAAAWAITFIHPRLQCGANGLVFAFHAEVSNVQNGQRETAWGKGIATGSNWSMGFQVPCPVEPN